MKLVEGAFGKYRVGYARVLIEIETESKDNLIEIDLYKDDPWNEQLLNANFIDWFEGAIYGAKYGLEIAKISTARVKIKRIVGLIVDTNSITVAAAAADAVWKTVGFESSASLIKQIEDANRKSVDYKDLAKFNWYE